MIKTSPFPTIFLQDLPGLWGPRIQGIASQPFSVQELEKRILQKTKDGKKAKPAFYIDPRTLDHRLNLIFGGAWSVGFNPFATDDTLVIRATLNVNGIVREDLSSESLMTQRFDYDTKKKIVVVNELAATAAQAAAYKRAAVKFGVGAYLYEFKNEIIWLPVHETYKSQFKDPDIKLQDLPEFARPVPGKLIVFNELSYLCGTEDNEVVLDMLKTYWGQTAEDIKTLDRDDCFRLAASIARVSDFLALSGKEIAQLAEERDKASKNEPQMRGFGS